MRAERTVALALIFALAAGTVWAKALPNSPRPQPRPAVSAPQAPPALVASPGGVALPFGTRQSPLSPPAAAESSPGVWADPALARYRPHPRPDTLPSSAPTESLPPPADPRLAGARPKPRPEGLAGSAPEAEAKAPTADPRLAGFRPKPRPETLYVPPPETNLAPESTAAPAARPTEPEVQQPPPGGVLRRLFGGHRKRNAPKPETQAPAPEQSLRGSVCGVPGLIGQEVAPIGNGGRGSGCGIAEPVRITSVSGIKLTQPMTVDCTTAVAFKRWVDRGIIPAVGGKGGGLAKLDVGPGYVCRPRNGVRGAKLSEHGHGKAIDLMGIVLKNGQNLDVLRGWKSQPRLFKSMHASACGLFGTVLGPKADRYHQNHIHVDTIHYRSGTYCR